MNPKVKACFTPHVMMHSLFGLGLGFALAAIFPALPLFWLGVVIMIVATLLDATRKA